MRILIVAATIGEVQPLLTHFNAVSADGTYSFTTKTHSVTVLITGVGIMLTTFSLTRHLATYTYNRALNMGVCGSFNRLWPLGQSVNIVSDRFADWGVEDGDSFLDVFDIDLQKKVPPFNNTGAMEANWPTSDFLNTLPTACGITVNTVHGQDDSIQKIVNKYAPDTESMEGAAFMYVCHRYRLPCLQVRGISNYVERRNRAAWKLKEAIENNCETAIRVMNYEV